MYSTRLRFDVCPRPNLEYEKVSLFCFCQRYRKIPKISPGAYIFLRSFLRGLYTEGNLRFKIGYIGLYLETSCISKSIGLTYSWKEIYGSNLREVFTETRREDVDLTKTQPCKYFVYIEREIQGKGEGWTMQTAIYCDTFWLQSIGTSNSSLANKKKYVLLYRFCFVLFCIWGQFLSTSPRGL